MYSYYVLVQGTSYRYFSVRAAPQETDERESRALDFVSIHFHTRARPRAIVYTEKKRERERRERKSLGKSV